MQITSKKLPKSELELTIELSLDEMKPYMEKAAVNLSTMKPIEGFRPGKAPLDIVAKKYGDMAILESAAEEAVRATFPKAVMQEKVLSIGSPRIGVTKMAPGNPFVYTATVTLLPEVTLTEISKIKIEKKEVTIPPADVARAAKDLRMMRAKETVTDRAAEKTDKVVIDMDMKLDGVPLEGGQARGHQVYLDEAHYVPGLTEALVGLKKGDTKSFTLTFPAEHYQKNVAGKPVDFHVTVTDVFERTLPEYNDEFAKTLGQENIAALDKLIAENLKNESETKENQRQEIAALDEIVKQSKFGDIPDILVNEEVGRMIFELRDQITSRGMEWDGYLAQIKKTDNQLKLDFVPQALQRIKVALAIRSVALAENIDVTDAEVAAEVAREMSIYKDDAETQTQIRSEEYAERVRVVLRNRKVIEYIKKTVIK